MEQSLCCCDVLKDWLLLRVFLSDGVLVGAVLDAVVVHRHRDAADAAEGHRSLVAEVGRLDHDDRVDLQRWRSVIEVVSPLKYCNQRNLLLYNSKLI